MALPSKKPYEKIPGGKRGVLSNEERDFIRKNILNMDIDTISKEIGKSVTSIKKFAYKENLLVKENANDEGERLIKIRRTLRSREYWPEIKKQFTPEEIKTFEFTWVKLYSQFNEDVLMSEEIQMKKYISLELLKDRCLTKANAIEEDIGKLRAIVDEENAKPKGEKNIEAVRQSLNNVAILQGRQFDFYKEYRELSDKQKDTEKALKISRDDRIKSILDSTNNWSGNIRLINENPEVRTMLGKHIQIMKIAQQNEANRLMDYHTFIDKSVDKPILSAESINLNLVDDD